MISADAAEFVLTHESVAGPKRRNRRDPRPHFQVDRTAQLDPLMGSPAMQVPQEHAAWQIREWVELFDTAELEGRYSSLGRRGYHPKQLLGLWLLASLSGIHHATRLASACKTDAAFRLVSGGHAPSATILKDFRRNSEAFLIAAVARTVELAVERGLVDPRQLAVDSMRLQADASTKSVRTVERSKKRLAELAASPQPVDPSEQRARAEKVRKHEEALQRCEEEGRTSHSVTDPHAALMKFPNGAALPGHRVTVASSGMDNRFVVAVLIGAGTNDYGTLETVVRASHEALKAAGVPMRAGGTPMVVAADAGYWSEADLVFAQENRNWADILINEPAPQSHGKNAAGEDYFKQSDFTIVGDQANCPAGRAMKGPLAAPAGRGLRWTGVGCGDCPLKSKCCAGKYRTLTHNPRLDEARVAMRNRMAEPGAVKRYGERIGTVEPVFSYIQDAMGFRRSSSRHTNTVRAEILLKVLAYNLTRLAMGRPLCVLYLEQLQSAGSWSLSCYRPDSSTGSLFPSIL